MDLFDHAHQERLKNEAPLAARMRPRTMDEFIGQDHIVGPGRLLRRAIQADQLGSLIFYGPPGTGKTTLARVIANTTRAHFIALNAVLSGVKEIRGAVAEAQERAKHYSQRTILFVDEVHRFNKAQQDALLPWVENGTVIFIGATTENPYFEVNKALVSRSRIFQLQPLTQAHLRAIVQQALDDDERGYGRLNVAIDDDAFDHLIDVAGGDARGVLNALELAVETTEESEGRKAGREVSGTSNQDQRAKTHSRDDTSTTTQRPSPLAPRPSSIHITLAIAEESIQRRAVLYDKEGDYHFDTISAFIKSLRGSDPDAAMYWMAKMIYAGESPRFLFRRMFIFAGEDIGMADPNAVQVVSACSQAFEWVGMPEGRFPLAQAALYLATAPKSNSAFALFDALAMVEQEADSGVPNHLRDANRDSEGFGHGEGYLYPHAYRDHWVAQQYLPTSLQGKVFYEPSDQGYEASISEKVARRREAQLAAMVEAESDHVEMLTFSPDDPARERWLQRTVSGVGARLGELRDRIFETTQLPRHGLILDLKAGTGLLTWEAMRRVPEGGVYSLARNPRDAEVMQQQVAHFTEVERPIVLTGTPADLPALFGEEPPPLFDAIIGYNSVLDLDRKEEAIAQIAALLGPGGVLSLAERLPPRTQRLYRLIDWNGDEALLAQVIAAEEAIYTQADDPLVNWNEDDLLEWLESAGLSAETQVFEETGDVQITDMLLKRWFSPSTSGRPSYVERLQRELSPAEIVRVESRFERQLRNRTVSWAGAILYLRATKSDQ